MPTAEIPAVVTAPWASPKRVLCVPSRLTAAIHDWAATERPGLPDGPHFNINGYRIYGERGDIKTHKDDAGLTMGLVLVADGPRFLEVAGQRWPLFPGSVYLIDSDQEHAAPCAWSDGLLVIACRDFYGPSLSKAPSRDPMPSPTKFAFDGISAAVKAFHVDLKP